MGSKLINCSACNEEISKSAKACPHCGEKNGIKGIRKFINIVFGLLFAYLFFAIFISGSSTTPSCDSNTATSGLLSTFDKSQYARMLSLSAVDASNIKQASVSEDKKSRSCSATLLLNNSNSVNVTYDLKYRDSDKQVLIFMSVEQ